MTFDPHLSIEEQEFELDEQERRSRERRRFDEGFAEFQHRREEEELDRIEEEAEAGS